MTLGKMLRYTAVSVNNILTNVAYILPNDYKRNEDTVILFIPGNPGIIEFYDSFLEQLFENCRIPLFGISYAGHNIAEHESALVNRIARQLFPHIQTNKDKAYTLEEQIQHKMQFIRQYLHKAQNIILIAHSLGSYMTLSLLQRISKEYNIVRVILLFPVFERTMETTKGKKFVPRFQNFRHSLIRTGHVIENLPSILRESIYSIAEQRYKADNAKAMKKALKALLTPTCARNIAQMLDDLSQFGCHDKFSDIFTDYANRLTLYYGSDDAWTPLTYCQRLSERYPSVDVQIDNHGIQHCFVLESCVKLSEIVSSLIDLRKIDQSVRVIKVRSKDENENSTTETPQSYNVQREEDDDSLPIISL